MVTLQSMQDNDTRDLSCDLPPTNLMGSPMIQYDETASKFCFNYNYPYS